MFTFFLSNKIEFINIKIYLNDFCKTIFGLKLPNLKFFFDF